KGTVESEQAMLDLTKQRKAILKKFPNLVDYESKQTFRHFYDPAPLPHPGTTIDDIKVERTFLGGVKRVPIQRPFVRSSEQAHEKRRRMRIGIPRVLNVYTTGAFWRTYLETLGVQKQNVVFSDYTSEEMWLEGGKYGSIDPCYPSKVAQAHLHNLIFHHHDDEKKLQYIWFPCITHTPPGLNKVMDTASCPIVAGAPEVMKAAFTKETDFFATRGIKYRDGAVTFTEPTLLKSQLFKEWGELLGCTEDESDFAVDQGWKAMDKVDADLQAKGRAILEQVEEENRVSVLMIGRPYHTDPGLNHGILEEFQVL